MMALGVGGWVAGCEERRKRTNSARIVLLKIIVFLKLLESLR
jgi:hypothetical protein